MNLLKTKEELFLKEIGRKLVNTGMHRPEQFLESEQEQKFYLKNPVITIPILIGYAEKAEERAFDDDTSLGADYRKCSFAEEAVRALSLIKKIVGKEDETLFKKANERIINIGDKANIARPEYALEGITYGINFHIVPFAYNNADGTLERKLETSEWVIEKAGFIPDLEENTLALYSNIGKEHAKRIAEKLSKQYLKPIESFEHPLCHKDSIERVLGITKILFDKRKDLFEKIEESLDKELLVRVKYPNSRIAKTDKGIIVVLDGGEKIITINGGKKEIVTQPT